MITTTHAATTAPAGRFTPSPTWSTARPAGTHFVVTYHYIREQNSAGVTALTPRAFAEQVRDIARRFRIVTAEEFVALHNVEAGLALITFDDALADQWLAAEILDELGLPGVFFAPMRPYSDELERWCSQHLLHALAQEIGWRELERRLAPEIDNEVDAAAVDRLYAYETPEKRRLKYWIAFALPPALSSELLREVNADVGLAADDWYLSARQLQQLQDAGHSLGGHGFDHQPYNTMSPKEMAADLHRAVQTMNARFGTLPRTLAWPFGRVTPVAATIARGCGYTWTFTTADRIDARDVSARLHDAQWQEPR